MYKFNAMDWLGIVFTAPLTGDRGDARSLVAAADRCVLQDGVPIIVAVVLRVVQIGIGERGGARQRGR